MATATRAVFDPVSSGEIQTLDLERAEEVSRRHQLLASYLDLKGDDALLLRRPSNFAWLTCGADNTRLGTGEMDAALFITEEARVVLCNSVDSGQLFDRQLVGLGFQLKERPWEESLEVLSEDLCRGRRVAVDGDLSGLRNATTEMGDFRRHMTERELGSLRALGKLLAHSVEATARGLAPGESEAEIAGQIAHRLLRHEIVPVRIQVMADGRGHRYRHWGFSGDRVHRQCVISALGRRGGLHCGVTRTVCLGPPETTLLESHQLAGVVAATAMYFSQAGWELRDTWQRVQRIYEKFGAPNEWYKCDQGEVIGYEATEVRVTPQSSHRLTAGAALFWHPTVNAAAIGETAIVRSDHVEHVTQSEDWPQIAVNVKGTRIQVPDILCREM
jgi:Xaa-Pro dipeptidase